MVMFKFILICFSTYFLLLFKQINCSGMGKCPKLEYMNDFNLIKFSGHWYEIERSFYLMQVVSSCVNIDLSENLKHNYQLEVLINTKSLWTGGLTVSEGLATQTKRHPSLFIYKVSSKLPRVFNRYLPGAGFYQVLNTDYDNYAIIYSCTNYGLIHTDLIWIWGRQKEFNVTLRQQIYNFLTSKHLDSERLVLAKHVNCTDD